MSARGATLTVTERLVTETCCGCHVLFAITEELRDRRLEDKKQFFCPNGHSQSYVGETKEEKLRKERDALERQLASARGNEKYYRERAESEKKSHAATKGVLTKTKKRVANGVCPVCNRSFVQLANHMQGQHPQYDKEPA